VKIARDKLEKGFESVGVTTYLHKASYNEEQVFPLSRRRKCEITFDKHCNVKHLNDHATNIFE